MSGRSERVRDVLAEVMDPEIPAVSVLDLGIVRDISDDGRRVAVTPTYSGCPATIAIEAAMRRALAAAGLADVEIETRLEPAWTTDWITPEGRAHLLAYGIAPPPHSSHLGAAPACPRCGSLETSEVSRFGSTPCKALWRCLACGEPFDRFKCH